MKTTSLIVDFGKGYRCPVFRLLLLIGLWILVAVTPLAAETQPKEIIVCSDPWPPIANPPTGGREGYAIDLLRGIFEPLGYRVRYLGNPWSRCIRETREGVCTALVGCYAQEVPGFILPQEPLGISEQTFYTSALSTWTYSTPESLHGVMLGAIQDYSYGHELDAVFARAGRSLRIVRLTGNESLPRLIDMVLNGRLHAVVENRTVMEYTLSRLGKPASILRRAGGANERPPIFAGFSPSRPDALALAAAFDQGVRAMRADGRLKELLGRYGLVDWNTVSEAIPVPSPK